MPTLTLKEPSPFSPRQIYDMVADVARYPQFLPWCRAARLTPVHETEFLAELVVAFAHITEQYTSRVTLHPPVHDHAEARVDAIMVKGPFHHLTNYWVLRPLPDGGTEICLDLDFQFKSRMLDMLIGGFFQRASEKMVAAFRERAVALYGSR